MCQYFKNMLKILCKYIQKTLVTHFFYVFIDFEIIKFCINTKGSVVDYCSTYFYVLTKYNIKSIQKFKKCIFQVFIVMELYIIYPLFFKGM